MRTIRVPIIAACLLAAACGSDPSSPGGDTPAEGSWSGTTADGGTVSFQVSGSTVTGLQVSIVYDFEPSGLADTVVWNPGSATISGNAFSVSDSIPGNPSYTFSMNGTFSPPDNVSGDVSSEGTYHPDSMSTEIATIDESWSATHQGRGY